jgi:hypothetical protein
MASGGAANVSPWKERIALSLEEQELWDIVHHIAIAPVVIPTDPTQLTACKKKKVKAKRLFLDAVKDHLIRTF